MNWPGKRVLVTGGGGFIGSHLVERLVELGARPRALVHYHSKSPLGWLERSAYRKDIEVVPGDVRDRDTILPALEGAEVVFHLAALIAIPYSYNAPVSYVRTNVEGTANILQGARSAGVERFVHASTSEVYGTAEAVPIPESHPLRGQSPYAASKIGADKMAESFHLSYGLPVVTVRPFNAFGPRQSSRAIVPTIIAQCLSGKTVCLGNVEPTRDLSYVSDTVEGFILAGGSAAAVGRTINIGSGREISVRELVHVLSAVVGREVEIEIEERRIRPKGSEVERLLADNALARELLGWKPQVSLEEGLRRTVAWIRDNPDEFCSAG